jgi:hypothetical protein
MNAMLALPLVLLWLVMVLKPAGLKRALMVTAVFAAAAAFAWYAWKFWYFSAAPKQKALFKETGVIFYIGNNPAAHGTYRKLPNVRASARGHSLDARRIVDMHLGRPATDKEMNDYWLGKGLEFIRENPGRWLKLEAAKFFLTFNDYEVPNSENYDFTRLQSWPLKLPLVGFGLAGPLGVLGLFFWDRKRKTQLLLAVFCAAYAASLLITYVTAAYRLPLYPPFFLLGAHGLTAFFDRARSAGWRSVRTAGCVLLAAFAFMNFKSYLSPARYEMRTFKRIEKARVIVEGLKSSRAELETDDYLMALKDV